jgi:hypothetical protein
VSRAPDPTLVRHIYDLHVLREHIDPAVMARLACEIATADAAEFGNQHPAYAADIQGETRKTILALQTDPAFRAAGWLFDRDFSCQLLSSCLAASSLDRGCFRGRPRWSPQHASRRRGPPCRARGPQSPAARPNSG